MTSKEGDQWQSARPWLPSRPCRFLQAARLTDSPQAPCSYRSQTAPGPGLSPQGAGELPGGSPMSPRAPCTHGIRRGSGAAAPEVSHPAGAAGHPQPSVTGYRRGPHPREEVRAPVGPLEPPPSPTLVTRLQPQLRPCRQDCPPHPSRDPAVSPYDASTRHPPSFLSCPVPPCSLRLTARMRKTWSPPRGAYSLEGRQTMNKGTGSPTRQV